MEASTDPTLPRVAAAFVLRFLQDREDGNSRTLREYQALHPGYESLIETEWSRIHSAFRAGSAPKQDRATTGSRLPERFGPYRIEREIARGGQAVVLDAVDDRFDRPVALKVLRGGARLSPTSLARFQSEARILAGLDHPAFCPLYEVGEEDGRPFLVLGRVPGVSLATKLAQRRRESGTRPGRVEVAAAARFIEEAARSLHLAHERGIVHRDLKPGNLMITPEGHPVILDFGLAKLLDDENSRLTRTGDVVGTPAYVAPEQVADDARPVDRSTDVHALGIVLHEMVTLARAFDATDREELFRQIRERPPTPARALNASVSRDLGLVIATATEKDPARRYRTSQDLAEDLARVLSREPPRARRPRLMERAAMIARRHPSAALVSVTVPLLLTVALGVAWREDARIRTARHELEYKRTSADGAAREARERLAEFHRMDDLVRLDDLSATEPLLHPPSPALIPDLERWLDAVGELRARLPGHRARRDTLRARASLESPPGPDFVAGGDDANGLRWRVVRTLDAIAAERRRGPTSDRARQLDALEAEFRSGLAEMEAAGAGRPRFVFATPEDQWFHDSLDHLVQGLEALGGVTAGSGLVASVERRLARARTISGVTIEAREEPWKAAAAAIAANPRFEGFRLEPQVGLIPLGSDPSSGLQEFAHFLSGQIPARAPDGTLGLVDSMAIVLVLLPGGRIRMGAERNRPVDDQGDPRADADEAPVHSATLDPFLISKFEMTQSQWQSWTGNNPSAYPPKSEEEPHRPTPRCPVEQVSWDDAERVLFEMGLVLPTEAQWEYASRAGSPTPWWTGKERASVLGAGNFADAWLRSHGGVPGWNYEPDLDDGWAGPAPAGSFRPNAFGLHDVIGNVHEWCRDRYTAYTKPALPGEGLRATEGTSGRTFRGGSFCTNLAAARTANRAASAQSTGQHDHGIRPAMRVALR